MSTPHTPVPWHLADDGTIRSHAFVTSALKGDYRGIIVCDLKTGTGSDEWLAIHGLPPSPEADANAQFILRACNGHRELVAALTFLAEMAEYAWKYVPALDRLRRVPELPRALEDAHSALAKVSR